MKATFSRLCKNKQLDRYVQKPLVWLTFLHVSIHYCAHLIWKWRTKKLILWNPHTLRCRTSIKRSLFFTGKFSNRSTLKVNVYWLCGTGLTFKILISKCNCSYVVFCSFYRYTGTTFTAQCCSDNVGMLRGN